MTYWIRCPYCHGMGCTLDEKECPLCEGTGRIAQTDKSDRQVIEEMNTGESDDSPPFSDQ